ncbi:UNVERIFIED_CONTAM: hypothetical protein Slati_3824800 [Sesamum latifolium]|uniref:Uncharacterized protein n=1 Tax=Sesamum latifolium TaxID=2727402 RepID=A0AAW2TL16_9LAMI
MIFSRNTNAATRDELANFLGIAIKDKHDKYFGLPTTVGRSKRDVFEGIKDRFWQKINGWATNKLSQAGRAVLIKSVLQVVPSYVMNYFEIPESFLKELEGMMGNFFWQGGGSTKTHWIVWHKICCSKEEGGLDFRHLKEFNRAMLAKQAWMLAMNLDCLLHKILQLPNSNFFKAGGCRSPSFTWRSNLRSRDLLVADLRWQIKNGELVLIVKGSLDS